MSTLSEFLEKSPFQRWARARVLSLDLTRTDAHSFRPARLKLCCETRAWWEPPLAGDEYSDAEPDYHIVLTFDGLRFSNIDVADYGSYSIHFMEELKTHPWLLRFQPQLEILCHAPIPDPVDFLTRLSGVFRENEWGDPLSHLVWSYRTDMEPIPFLNLGINPSLKNSFHIVAQAQFALCKGPRALISAVESLLTELRIPFIVVHSGDLDPLNKAPEVKGETRLYQIGRWLIAADKATIEIEHMPNAA